MLENIKPMMSIDIRNVAARIDISKINDNFYTAEICVGRQNNILLRTAFTASGKNIGVAALERLEKLLSQNPKEDPATEILSEDDVAGLLPDIKGELARWMDADEKGLCVPEHDDDKKTEIFVTQNDDAVELVIRRRHTVDEHIRVSAEGPVSIVIEDGKLKKPVTVNHCQEVLWDTHAPIYDHKNDFAAFRNAYPETRIMDRYAISEFMVNHENTWLSRILSAIEQVRSEYNNRAALELFDHRTNPPALIPYGVHQNFHPTWSFRGEPQRIYVQDEKLMVDYIDKPAPDAVMTAELCMFDPEFIEKYGIDGQSADVIYKNAVHLGRNVLLASKRKE